MAAAPLLLAIDQGTTSSRAMVFDSGGNPIGSHQVEFAQHFPEDGWVEHDADEIWDTVVTCCREAISAAGATAEAIAAIGISNQRETTVLWDRATGKPVHRAIVWQDRRTAPMCRKLVEDGHEPDIQARTGLLIDAYFSASKLEWLLDNVDGARQAAEAGELAFGTIDTFLLWRLTGGKVHATDATNASRTMLFNIHEQDWDRELLARFNIPRSVLPDVRDSAGDFGSTDPDLLGAAIPIRGIAGDQQAALVGQACFEPGMIKSTYGTGAFVLANTGATAPTSTNRLLTTVACRLGGKVTYALEGSIFIAGAAVQWLRDGLGVIGSAEETRQLAIDARDGSGVVMVPAFTGLGAPWWDPDARGAILGLTRDTGRAEIVRATLDAVCFQTRDLLDAMAADGASAETLRVDGGMVANDWLAQRLADLTGLPLDRPAVTETTALGAAYLAGLGAGIFASTDEIAAKWQSDRAFTPEMDASDRDVRHGRWQTAVARVRSDAV